MTCRKTRAALSENVADFTDRDFFRDKFTAEELRALAGSRPIADLFSAKSPSVKALGLDPASMSDAEMLEWMVQEPRLIKRPILVVDGVTMIQPKLRELEALR